MNIHGFRSNTDLMELMHRDRTSNIETGLKRCYI